MKKRSRGRQRGMPARIITEPMIDEACRLYQIGLSLAEVGRHFGVSRQAVFYHLKERVTFRSRGPKGIKF